MIGLAFFHWRYSMPQNHMQIRHLRHTKRVFCLFSRSTYRTVHCEQFSQFIVHYKIIGIIGGSSFSRCTFFSLYLSLYFIEAIKFFPVLSSLVFRVRCNQIDRNAFRNFWNEGIASKIVFRRYQYIWLTTTEQNTEAKRMNKSIWI